MFNVLKICGQNIRQYRKARDLTLDQMSHSMGITGAYLGYLERGQRNPSLLTLAKIADTLEVSPHLLLRGLEDDFDKELQELIDMLIKRREARYVVFLKEVMLSYLKLIK